MALISMTVREGEPTDDIDDYDPGDIAIYARADRDNQLYFRPYGGPEKAVASALGDPDDVTDDRALGEPVANKSGKLRSADVAILISEDIGSTNANKQGAVSTEIAIEGTRVARHRWDELKLYTDEIGTVVSVILQHEFTVAPGQSYTLSVIENDFANAELDSWIMREW